MTRPVLLHIPHSSLAIPEQWRDLFVVSDDELAQELLLMTDAFTDELFDLGDMADRLVFPVSRLLVDPERFENDEDEPMAARGMGAVYTRTHDGRVLKKSRRAELMEQYYRPHHESLTRWAQELLTERSRCLIIDCHSFPSVPIPCDMNQTPVRQDICIGTSPIHTSEGLVAGAVSAFKNQGWSVSIDTPYAGTIVPIEHSGKEPGVSSIMVEVNRRLYMDETTGLRSGAFDGTKRMLVASLVEVVEYWVAV